MADEQPEIVDAALGREHTTTRDSTISSTMWGSIPSRCGSRASDLGWRRRSGGAARAGRYGDAWFPYFVEIRPRAAGGLR